MSKPPRVTPGQSRTCPICRATILESANVCPACRHHLRFESDSPRRDWTRFSPLRVEGTLRHPADGGAWEYSVLLVIHDEKGDEVARQVVGVGALKPSEERTFTLAVEVLAPAAEGVKTG